MEIEKSSGNVFKDMNCKDAATTLRKVDIAIRINKELGSLTAQQGTTLLGIPLHRYNTLRSGRLKSFSIQEIESLLNKTLKRSYELRSSN